MEITATGPIGRGMLAPASLSLERVQFTGGCSATSCEDLIRAVLMFIGRWRPRPGGSRRLLCAAVVVQLGPACVSCTREPTHMKFTTAVTYLFWEVAGAQ